MGERREGKGSRDVVLLRSGLMTECDCLYHVDLKLTCKYDFSSFRSNQRVVCGEWGEKRREREGEESECCVGALGIRHGGRGSSERRCSVDRLEGG